MTPASLPYRGDPLGGAPRSHQSRSVVDRDGDGRDLGGMMMHVGSHRFSRRDKDDGLERRVGRGRSPVLRLRQDRGRASSESGEEQGAPPPEQAKRSLEEAFSVVTSQLDLVFSTAGDTLRDPETKETLKQAGKAVMNALAFTVSDVGEEIRKRRR
jgi:hypothetical protein